MSRFFSLMASAHSNMLAIDRRPFHPTHAYSLVCLAAVTTCALPCRLCSQHVTFASTLEPAARQETSAAQHPWRVSQAAVSKPASAGRGPHVQPPGRVPRRRVRHQHRDRGAAREMLNCRAHTVAQDRHLLPLCDRTGTGSVSKITFWTHMTKLEFVTVTTKTRRLEKSLFPSC